METYEQLLLSLRQVNRAIDLHSKQLSKLSGFTGPQLQVIKRIAELNGPMAKKVAQEINLSPATVTNIIDRLEAKGLVERKRSSYDKRRVELYVTAKGQALLAQAPQSLQAHFISRFQDLEMWEQNQLLSSVQRIATMMEFGADVVNDNVVNNNVFDRVELDTRLSEDA